MKTGWIKYVRYAIGLVVVLGIIVIGYLVPGSGFGNYTSPTGEFVRGKTFWDWMQLLIIPLVLAVGAYYLNRAERQTEREIARDRQQEAALQAYLDRLSELLLKEKLRTTKKAEVRDVARTRTISIIRVLNTERTNLVLQFLREAKLVTDENSILNGADMGSMHLGNLDFDHVFLQTTNLSESNLEGAYLAEANLERADLMHAYLAEAYLEEAHLAGAYLFSVNLEGADLQGTDLKGADLEGADLKGADLKGADLMGVNLAGVNLEGAEVTDEQLARAQSLKGATMPDGTKHE